MWHWCHWWHHTVQLGLPETVQAPCVRTTHPTRCSLGVSRRYMNPAARQGRCLLSGESNYLSLHDHQASRVEIDRWGCAEGLLRRVCQTYRILVTGRFSTEIFCLAEYLHPPCDYLYTPSRLGLLPVIMLCNAHRRRGGTFTVMLGGRVAVTCLQIRTIATLRDLSAQCSYTCSRLLPSDRFRSLTTNNGFP